MAGTLADMKTRITGDLARSNLASQIADAITTAISQYQKERFRFSDTTPSAVPTFNTVINQWIYTSADNANISTLMNIDYVLMLLGSTLQRLTLVTPQEVRQYNQNGLMHGFPMFYAYEGGQLLISPIPDAVYAMTLDVFRNVAAPASDAEAGNPWMLDGELLIRSRAKFEIATHVTRNTAMQEAMSPYMPPPGKATGHATWYAWKALKGEANRVNSLKRVRAMQF